MTVCITAIADDHEAIVSCVDTRISTAITSFDPVVGRKICGFRGWAILTSGTLPHAEALVDRIQELLGKAATNDPPDVQQCLDNALRIEVAKFTAARYLTPYGLDMSTFLASRKGFTDERWTELNRQIGEYAAYYDVELTVSGWGDTQANYSAQHGQRAIGYIFSISGRGIAPYGRRRVLYVRQWGSRSGFCAFLLQSANTHGLSANHLPCRGCKVHVGEDDGRWSIHNFACE